MSHSVYNLLPSFEVIHSRIPNSVFTILYHDIKINYDIKQQKYVAWCHTFYIDNFI